MLKHRGQPIDANDNGLFEIIENPKSSKEFNNLLKQILGYNLSWTVDLSNTGDYYVKINNNGDHDSDGLGEGLVSLLFLVEALLNSSPDKLLVIDEPELSLHPQFQRNLLDIILEKSEESQILYATHSPEMVSIEAILNSGTLCRVENQGNGSKIHKLDLDSDTRKFLENSIENIPNPHVLGYDARSCFFVEDRLVIVEGQEDVVLLKKALVLLGIEKKINFFGFGAGGAGNIQHIVKILSSLGFERICCLYDRNEKDALDKTKKLFPKKEFPHYDFELLNANDIRDKVCRFYDNCKNRRDGCECKSCYMKEGIFDKDHEIKSKYEDIFKSLLNRIGDMWIEE